MARKTVWSDILVNSTIANGAQSGVDLTGEFDERSERRGLTLTRLLIDICLIGNAVSEAVSGHSQLTMGVAVLDSDAFIGAIFPDPQSQDDQPPRPWVWRTSQLVASAQSDGVFPGVPRLIKADIRSQRMLGMGQLVLIMHNQTLTGTAFSIRAHGIMRGLYLLP